MNPETALDVFLDAMDRSNWATDSDSIRVAIEHTHRVIAADRKRARAGYRSVEQQQAIRDQARAGRVAGGLYVSTHRITTEGAPMTGEDNLDKRGQHIDEMIDMLSTYWHAHPVLRLGQLISNLAATVKESVYEFDYIALDKATKLNPPLPTDDGTRIRIHWTGRDSTPTELVLAGGRWCEIGVSHFSGYTPQNISGYTHYEIVPWSEPLGAGA